MAADPSHTDELRRLQAELEQVISERDEALDALRAIRDGEIDAVVVSGSAGDEVYVLNSADRSYRILVEQMQEGAAITGPSGVVLYANPTLATLLQRPTQALIGRSLAEFVMPPDRGAFQRMLAGALAGPAKEEVALAAAGGTPVPVYVSASPLGVGDADGLCLIVTDLTLQKRSEVLAADERLARSVLEHVTEAVVVCDAEGRVTRMSEEAMRLVGHAPPLAHFADVFALTLARTELTSAEALVRAALRGRRVRGVDAAMVSADGRRRDFVVAAGPLWGTDQRVIGCIIVLTDLTEYRRIQEGLRASQRMDSIGRLAGGMAHEINNQMTVVLGFAAFAMAERGLPPTLSDDIVQIHRAAERAASITRQLLAFSRRQLLQPTVRSLNEVVHSFEPVLRRLMPASVTLHTSLAADPDLVRIDAGQFEQVILNLVLNAFDAMPRGGEVRMETATVDVRHGEQPRGATTAMTPGPYVRFTVADVGAGITPELMEQLFEPFFTTKPIGKGTGLGLSTVYGIVKQSGGYVWAVSEPGRGATFDVYLPMATLDAPGAPERGTGAEVTTPATGDTVLVVEDEPSVRHLAVRTLREAGYVVHEAADGVDALERIADLPVLHLVVSDLAMPRMDGRALALRLRESRPGLQVIIMSGLPSENGQRADVPEGQVLLQKPFAPDALVQVVRAALAGALP